MPSQFLSADCLTASHSLVYYTGFIWQMQEKPTIERIDKGTKPCYNHKSTKGGYDGILRR